MMEINLKNWRLKLHAPEPTEFALYFKNCEAVRYREFLHQIDNHPQYLGVTGMGLLVMFAVWKISIKQRA